MAGVVSFTDQTGFYQQVSIVIMILFDPNRLFGWVILIGYTEDSSRTINDAKWRIVLD